MGSNINHNKTSGLRLDIWKGVAQFNRRSLRRSCSSVRDRSSAWEKWSKLQVNLVASVRTCRWRKLFLTFSVGGVSISTSSLQEPLEGDCEWSSFTACFRRSVLLWSLSRFSISPGCLIHILILIGSASAIFPLHYLFCPFPAFSKRAFWFCLLAECSRLSQFSVGWTDVIDIILLYFECYFCSFRPYFMLIFYMFL